MQCKIQADLNLNICAAGVHVYVSMRGCMHAFIRMEVKRRGNMVFHNPILRKSIKSISCYILKSMRKIYTFALIIHEFFFISLPLALPFFPRSRFFFFLFLRNLHFIVLSYVYMKQTVYQQSHACIDIHICRVESMRKDLPNRFLSLLFNSPAHSLARILFLPLPSPDNTYFTFKDGY